MYANGGSLVEKDGDSFKVTVNSPENIATWSVLCKANNEVNAKGNLAGGTTDNPVEYFKNGDAAILLSGSWNYNTFTNEISKFDFGVMLLQREASASLPSSAAQLLQFLRTERIRSWQSSSYSGCLKRSTTRSTCSFTRVCLL